MPETAHISPTATAPFLVITTEGYTKHYSDTEPMKRLALILFHAYYHSLGIHGTSNNELTTNFENLCRKIFLGKWGSNEIRKGSASYEH